MQRNAIKIRNRIRGNDKKNETKDKVNEGRIKREGKDRVYKERRESTGSLQPSELSSLSFP